MQRRIPRGDRRPHADPAAWVGAGSALLLLIAIALYALRPGLVVPPPPPDPVPVAAGDWLESRIRQLPLTGGAGAIAAPRRRNFAFRPPRLPLPGDVGPDWAVVEEYLERRRAWTVLETELALADIPAEQKWRRRQDAWSERPEIRRAIAAATAIVEAGGAQERVIEAAGFLVAHATAEPDADWHMAVGARTLAAHAPRFDEWPRVMMQLDAGRTFAPNGQSMAREIDAFFERMAANAADPAVRALARYYVAVGLMRSANGFWSQPGVREARRQRALEAAAGLSAGVEQESFAPAQEPGSPFASIPPTLAAAEADLLHGIRHATVGGALSEMVGRRLDGSEDRLSAYAGRVLLIDFWATGCRRCAVERPALRELVAELPVDRFTLLGISVDEAPQAVIELGRDEPMPWTNWHAGPASDLARRWYVRDLPTYVLVDREGVVLARTDGLTDAFTSLIRRTVAAVR
ncbi:MAG: TlpA family protein disulfide reductase [Acidobacteria bacterium]|nr:TlpA family protein disulfide reductase [Acidobacteriota bacterium]